jgi:hypothetical protein
LPVIVSVVGLAAYAANATILGRVKPVTASRLLTGKRAGMQKQTTSRHKKIK